MNTKDTKDNPDSESYAGASRENGARARSPSEALEPERAPDRPEDSYRRQHPILRLMNAAMTGLLVLVIAVAGIFYYAQVKFDEPGPLANPTVVSIPKGEGVNSIATRLERNGAISDRRIFVASVIYFKAQEKLKAGEYQFGRNASMRQVLDTLVQGKSILHAVTVPEGKTSAEVVAILKKEPTLTGEIEAAPPEGSLLPDTYKFTRGMARQDMIDRMQAAQKKFLSKVWPKRSDDLPFKTAKQALTLASIVEKETGRADERPMIAGVFINRLEKGMRLQSDPTIIYGITGGDGESLGRGLTRSEIDKKTPYNTYQIDGLPPTPIANPGRAAIMAALNPKDTRDLYFVADGSGGHVFSDSLSEHNRNVAQWRKVERTMRAEDAMAHKDGAGAGKAVDLPGVTTEALPAGEQAAETPPEEEITINGTPLPHRNPRHTQ